MKPAALWRDPLVWLAAALVLAVLGMGQLKPLFAALYPELERPMYEQDSFLALLLAHVALVLLSSALAALLGVGLGLLVTRAWGLAFRPMVESVVAVGQTFPPVAVLALAVPVLGFGEMPAVLALALYGLLPVVQATLAGLDSLPPAVREAARGVGMSRAQMLWRVELPNALPVLLGGVRSSTVINIGTAAIASTVGVKTLGSPIIIGLSAFNPAYVIQGALLVGLLALLVDQLFERLTGLSRVNGQSPR